MNPTAEPVPPVEPDVPAKKRFSFKRIKKEIIRPDHCLNCGMHIPAHYLFCGNCGQENEPSAVSFGTLVKEVWEEFVKIDSKLIRTLVPLLFKPGYLTTEYLAGKRLSYLSPFRMYIAISALFFLVFGILLSPTNTADLEDRLTRLSQEQKEETDAPKKPDAPAKPGQPGEKTEKNEKPAKDKKPEGENTANISIDTGGNQFNIVGVGKNPKVSKISFLSIPPFKVRGVTVNLRDLPDSVHEYREKQKALRPIRRDPEWLHLLSEKVIRLNSEPMDALRNMASNGLPLVMFFLLPFYAIYMQLCYLRSKRLYVEHLVFILHIHSFLFLALAIDMMFRNMSLNVAVFWVSVLYNFLALRRVYGQSIMKTLWKMGLLAWGYFWLALWAFVGALICSLIWTLVTL